MGLQAGAEALAEGGLEAVPGGLGEGAAMIVDGEFPAFAAKEPGLFNRAVALTAGNTIYTTGPRSLFGRPVLDRGGDGTTGEFERDPHAGGDWLAVFVRRVE